MDKLLIYLNALSSDDQTAFAARCDTTVGYLRKACSKGQRLGEGLCIKIERESGGEVRCEAVRPDVDWAYLRNSLHAEPPLPADAGDPKEIQPNQAPALTPPEQAAITVIADGAQSQAAAPSQHAPANAASGAASLKAGDQPAVERRNPEAGPFAFPDLERRADEAERLAQGVAATGV